MSATRAKQDTPGGQPRQEPPCPFETIVLITRKTRLEELCERFNTLGQAKFYIEHSGGDFDAYVAEDAAYRASLETAQREVNALGLKVHPVDRSIVPTLLFSGKEIVIALGQDGLVANCAKYVGSQPVIGINPDPERFDGILLPFRPTDVQLVVAAVMEGRARVREVTLAQADMNDGRHLLAFNDLFIGAQTHVSARYRLEIQGREEQQSSSGILVSTGVGSTGWLSSVFNMASGVTHFLGGPDLHGKTLPWEDPHLLFVVREPFRSRHSDATLVAGTIDPGGVLTIESKMPGNGVIFSDGVEADYLEFNAGHTVTIHAASQHCRLVSGVYLDKSNKDHSKPSTPKMLNYR